jgi:hypothetical protein
MAKTVAISMFHSSETNELSLLQVALTIQTGQQWPWARSAPGSGVTMVFEAN